MSAKTVAFEDLVRITESLRQDRKSVVHCHGVFDLLHIGHIRYFHSARQHGDVLVVTVTPDRFVSKGPHRPVFEQRLRTEAVASLDCVDFVAVNDWPTAVEALRRLRPDVYVKGAEFRERKTPELLQEEAEAAALGIRVEFVEDEVTSSSTYLINHFLSPFTEEVDRYLAEIRRRWKAQELLGTLQRARELRAVVVGDAILDDYVFCSTLGQSTKSPNVVGRFQAQERYLGGALAVANHLAGFCREVQVLAVVGSEAETQREISERLRPEVRPHFVVRPASPTTVKRQFREAYFATVLFELDYLDDSPLAAPQREQLEARLRDALPAADLVLCRDCLVHFSHADVRRALANLRASGSRFLLTTTHVHAQGNRDIPTGAFWPLDLQAPPFLLPRPIRLIDEHCTHRGSLGEKCLGLWRMADVVPRTAAAAA